MRWSDLREGGTEKVLELGLDLSNNPFLISPLVGNEKVLEVGGWVLVAGEVNQSFLNPLPIF